jgi:hypothetical protein
MKTKVLELRDDGTFIALLCVDCSTADNEGQRYLLRRCGYSLLDGYPNVIITRLMGDGGKATNDPYYWGDRTYTVAHDYIIRNWDTLSDGDVVDVEHILGESRNKKVSERFGF